MDLRFRYDYDLGVDGRLVDADAVLAVDEVLRKVGLGGSDLFEEAVAGQDEQRDDVLALVHGDRLGLWPVAVVRLKNT